MVQRTPSGHHREVKRMGNKFTSLSELETLDSGSKWGALQTLAFRVLIKPALRKFPAFIPNDIRNQSDSLLQGFKEFQKAKEFLSTSGRLKLREATRYDLAGTGVFANFLVNLKHLVSEQEESIPTRQLRSQTKALGLGSSTETPNSTIGDKGDSDTLEQLDVDSSGLTLETNTSDAEVAQMHEPKGEPRANAVILNLLQGLWFCLPQTKITLSPSFVQDTFEISTPRTSCTTKNDGTVIHETQSECGASSVRKEPEIAYASVEAKQLPKLGDNEYAQFVSQIIGMIHQRGVPDPTHKTSTIFPVIYIADHKAGLILTTCLPEYYQFLKTGKVEDKMNINTFLVLTDCGLFDLTKTKEFDQFCQIVLALGLWLETGGEISYRFS